MQVLLEPRHVHGRSLGIDGIPGQPSRRIHAGVADRHDAEPERRVALHRRGGRDDVGHCDGNLAVQLHRLEAVRHDDEVAGDHAMQAHRRFVDGAFDAELGEDHEQARRHTAQRQQRAGTLALELLGAQRHGRRGAACCPDDGHRNMRPPAADARNAGPQARHPLTHSRDIGQGERHQRKVTRVSRPSTGGIVDMSSILISTCTTRASVDDPPSGSTRCMRFTVGAMRSIVPL